jgi:hypothetical protein
LSMHDVLFEQFDGLADVSSAAGIEDGPMVAVGLLLARRHGALTRPGGRASGLM